MPKQARIHIGKDEVVFLLAVGGLIAMTVGAVVFKRSADATLVSAFVGLLMVPVFRKSDRRDEDDR